MINFVFVRFVFLSMYFFAIQQYTTASTENNNCNPPEPSNKLNVLIFDYAYMAQPKLWKDLCKVINKFPEGAITMEYKPGALAVQNGKDLTCGTGDCKLDQYHACELLHYKYINDCKKEPEGDSIATIDCYCAGDSDKILLQNSKLREELGIPGEKVPTLVFNEKYDQCATIGNEAEIQNYICQTIFQNQKISPCS